MRARGRAIATALAAALAVAAVPSADSVVGGHRISISLAPWSVAIVERRRPKDSIDCTGVVIGADQVVTAAHCVFDADYAIADPDTLVVEAGAANVLTPARTARPQKRLVSAIRVHPGYRGRAYQSFSNPPDDVAVLTLRRPLDLSGPYVQALALANPAPEHLHRRAVLMAGYGREREGSVPSGALKVITGRTDGQGSCGFHPIDGEPLLLSPNAAEICAISSDGGVCYGDSGAGLVTATTPPVLLGILNSVPVGPCGARTHAVFAYVGAPEIRSFLEGDRRPPRAPQVDPELSFRDPPRAGSVVSCTGTVEHARTVEYLFLGRGRRVLQAGAGARYRVRPADVGSRITCRVVAANAGGTEIGEISTDVVRGR